LGLKNKDDGPMMGGKYYQLAHQDAAR